MHLQISSSQVLLPLCYQRVNRLLEAYFRKARFLQLEVILQIVSQLVQIVAFYPQAAMELLLIYFPRQRRGQTFHQRLEWLDFRRIN